MIWRQIIPAAIIFLIIKKYNLTYWQTQTIVVVYTIVVVCKKIYESYITS